MLESWFQRDENFVPFVFLRPCEGCLCVSLNFTFISISGHVTASTLLVFVCPSLLELIILYKFAVDDFEF